MTRMGRRLAMLCSAALLAAAGACAGDQQPAAPPPAAPPPDEPAQALLQDSVAKMRAVKSYAMSLNLKIKPGAKDDDIEFKSDAVMLNPSSEAYIESRADDGSPRRTYRRGDQVAVLDPVNDRYKLLERTADPFGNTEQLQDPDAVLTKLLSLKADARLPKNAGEFLAAAQAAKVPPPALPCTLLAVECRADDLAAFMGAGLAKFLAEQDLVVTDITMRYVIWIGTDDHRLHQVFARADGRVRPQNKDESAPAVAPDTCNARVLLKYAEHDLGHKIEWPAQVQQLFGH